MLENEQNNDQNNEDAQGQAGAEGPGSSADAAPPPPKKRTRKAAAKKAASEPSGADEAASPDAAATEPAKKPARKRASRAKKAVETPPEGSQGSEEAASPAGTGGGEEAQVDGPPAPKRGGRAKKKSETESQADPQAEPGSEASPQGEPAAAAAGGLVFQTPDTTAQASTAKTPRKRARKKAADDGAGAEAAADGDGATVPASSRGGTDSTVDSKDWLSSDPSDDAGSGSDSASDSGEDSDESGDSDGPKRRRRRGGRRRRKSGDGESSNGEGDQATTSADSATDSPGNVRSTDSDSGADSGKQSGKQSGGDSGDSSKDGDGDGDGSETGSRRRRRRRRTGEDGGESEDRSPRTSGRTRKARSPEDEITAVTGSTRLEAKKQRRREGREAGRRRAPIVSEAEFLARRESVDRVMAIRQLDDITQIAVLEDKVLVEHYVARDSQTSLIGNVYLGRVQNVLPSMEAAFIDIGKGRNAVLYAGEVNWSALGHKDGAPRKVESVLSSGQPVLVQVTKDPVGNKGARLTSQVSLAGRFLVYVPDGTTSGISRKLPDTERNRLKTLLKEIVPDAAGVIVRTAAEGATEDELTRDVERLKARWEDIEKKAGAKSAGAQLLYGEPDLTLKVVRDLFTEDFVKLIVEGADAWDIVQSYVSHVAPDLEERLERYEPSEHNGVGLFSSLRIEEQIHKGLDRKVYLPSGGSLVIDRTEAMTVVDVNTGKFTGSGGNLEETVTKNNLEAAEEIVRQLRLRDIGGIIVFDFIDMVLESNRDLVLRRLVECLGRDRTRHQVAEVTSLGLVQMTRKRIGTGLLEAFSQDCDHCAGRGVVVQDAPVEPRQSDDGSRGGGRTGRGRRSNDGGSNDRNDNNGRGNSNRASGTPAKAAVPSPRDVAAMSRADTDRPTEDSAVDPVAPLVDGPIDGPIDGPVDPGVEPTPAGAAQDEAPVGETQADETQADETQADETQADETPVNGSTPATLDVDTSSTEPEPEPVGPVARTTVVTRTRRRSASRPAGPPAAAAPTVSAPQSPDSDEAPDGVPEGVEGDDEESPHVEHVPIKKRGTRKR